LVGTMSRYTHIIGLLPFRYAAAVLYSSIIALYSPNFGPLAALLIINVSVAGTQRMQFDTHTHAFVTLLCESSPAT
jgi:hypothetical protein